MSKYYEYTLWIQEVTTYEAVVTARDEDEAVDTALEFGLMDHEVIGNDVEIEIQDKELVGQMS